MQSWGIAGDFVKLTSNPGAIILASRNQADSTDMGLITFLPEGHCHLPDLPDAWLCQRSDGWLVWQKLHHLCFDESLPDHTVKVVTPLCCGNGEGGNIGEMHKWPPPSGSSPKIVSGVADREAGCGSFMPCLYGSGEHGKWVGMAGSEKVERMNVVYPSAISKTTSGKGANARD